MNKNTIVSIAKKEFFGFFNSPLAYTIIVPFSLISTFLYFRSVLVVGEASLRPYFELLPWFLLLLAPALSMKLLTDEYKGGTFELLFAHPVSEFEIIFGKFLGVLGFFMVVLLTTVGLPLTIIIFSKADRGIIVSQYIGAIFIASMFLAIGIAASAYVKNAISSFLLAAAISFTFILISLDLVTLLFPAPISTFIQQVGLMTHLENIARGLLDIRDIAYFITVTFLFLTAAVVKLSERKLTEDKKEKRKLNIAFLLIAAIGFLANVILSVYPLRIDLTGSRLFTLSEGTKQTIKNLPDRVTISLFVSKNLPGQMQLAYRDITDLLKDYGRISSKVSIRTVYPDENSEAASEARSAGIQQMTFNRIGTSQFEVQNSYLGLSIRYADKTDSIPFINDTSDLEYQLTRRIRKLTGGNEQIIGLYTNGTNQYQLLTRLLGTQYKVDQVDAGKPDSLKNAEALLVIDDASQPSTASAMIKNYLDNGGKVLLLTNGVTINSQTLSVNKSTVNYPFISEWGITVNNDLTYDLQLAETLTFGQGNVQYLAPYPFWFRSLPQNTDFPPLATIKTVSLGWPSSIKINEVNGIKYKKLLTTSENANTTDSNFNISPESTRSLSTSSLKRVLLGVEAEKGDSRLVVIGNSNVVSDQFMQNNRDNVSFISNTVDWLAAEKDLAMIPSKSAGNAVLEFTSPTQIMIVQYSNLLLPSFAIVVFAIFYLRRRKQLTRRVYAQ